ncbi:MAG: AMP-binding protein [Solirubrobacteraceae bacterium]
MPDLGANAPERFRSFAERIVAEAEADPDRIVMSEPGRALTGREFAGLVARLARALEHGGLARGMRVAILATISPEALAVRYGAATLGCATVFCPNTGDRSRLRQFLGHVRADALVLFPETAAAAAAVVSEGLVRSVMSVGAVAGIDVDLLAVSATMSAGPRIGRTAGDDLGVLVSSGGTTGSAKASRRSFAAYGRMVDAGPAPSRRQLVCTPLAYVAQVLVDQALMGGGSAVMLRRFDPAEVLRTIATERITHLGLVEPALVELIDHPNLPGTDLSSLVAVSHIGANAPPSLRRRLLERVGPVLAHPYGASEAGIISVLAAPEYDVTHPELLSTVGRPLPGVQVRVQQDDGTPTPAGQPGSIVIRSAAAADGYDVDTAPSAFIDGWYHTGDLGLLDDRGYLHIRGRRQDLRRVCGQAVLPLDVSNALCSHRDVRYAVSVPAPADAGGFGSVVKLSPSAGLGESDLRAFVRDRYGPGLVPEVIALSDRIPTTEQGKPDRSAITVMLFGRDAPPAPGGPTSEGGI